MAHTAASTRSPVERRKERELVSRVLRGRWKIDWKLGARVMKGLC